MATPRTPGGRATVPSRATHQQRLEGAILALSKTEGAGGAPQFRDRRPLPSIFLSGYDRKASSSNIGPEIGHRPSSSLDSGQGVPEHVRPHLLSAASLIIAGMTTHELKSWPGQFQAMWTGLKRAEFRRDDRGYQVGDLLDLCEWDPSRQRYTGFRLTARVTHLLRGPELEVPAGFVVLSIEVLGARVVDSGSPPG
jgi:hypothetical protein